MDPTSESDPLFARFRAAWQAYLALHDSDIAPVPYTAAMADPDNPARQAAAAELGRARDAWLRDPS